MILQINIDSLFHLIFSDCVLFTTLYYSTVTVVLILGFFPSFLCTIRLVNRTLTTSLTRCLDGQLSLVTINFQPILSIEKLIGCLNLSFAV